MSSALPRPSHEGGVESAADADDDRLGMGVGDAFAEAERLDVEGTVKKILTTEYVQNALKRI